MTNFFYTNTNGQKTQVTEQQLQALATKGIIVPTTPLETDTGHQGFAGQIPGLIFNTAAPSPFAQKAQASPPSANVFCTNCGKSISEQAVACMSCGARPTGHKKFCRYCGVALNPEQVVCVKCGAGIGTAGSSRSVGGGSGTSWEKNKLVAGLLALFLGGIGAHKYYMGSWGWGIVFTAAVILTGFIASIVTCIIALVEGIKFLMMSEEAFAEKYPPETEAPFRW